MWFVQVKQELNQKPIHARSPRGDGAAVVQNPPSLTILLILAITAGCNVPPPGGIPKEPLPFGGTVDEITLQQEQNAELAKMIVYAHEFEINLQEDASHRAAAEKSASTFDYHSAIRPRGIRLTPSGEDHVKKIAEVLRNHDQNGALTYAVIERSESSKRWDTQHRYPVHQNNELDALRREVVVRALESMGVVDADQLVIVAPAYPTGLSATEAIDAYWQSTNSFGRDVRR